MFWESIIKACAADFADLRLLPPRVSDEGDLVIDSKTGILATVKREALTGAHDAAHIIVTIARAVAPKVL